MLKERITSILSSQRNRNKKYDCVVGFSGGRDSSYVLWYVVKKLGLKAIAYSADNCYVPEVAMRNMKKHTGAGMCDLFRYAALNPAKLLGIEDIGRVKKGGRANIIIVDEMINVRKVMFEGELV